MLGILLLLLAACGGGGGGGTKTSAPPTKGLMAVVVDPWDATVEVGATQQYTATGWYQDGTQKDLTNYAAWTSDDTTRATVSKGLATGVAATWSVRITAAYGTCTFCSDYEYLEVITPVAKLVSIDVTPATASIMAGETQPFTATGTYDDDSTSTITYSVTWSSSDTAVATMNSSGVATGGSTNGTVTITASKDGVTGTASLTVVSLTSIDVDPVSTEVQETATRQFTATANYSDGSTGDITTSVLWASSNTAIAVISNTAGSKGVATGMAIGGPVTITAAKDGISGNAASLTVTGKRPDLSVRITSAFSNGTDVYVSYTVKNTGLANSTGFDVDVWDDLAAAPAVGDFGDDANTHAGLDVGATLDGYVIIPSTLASGTAHAVVDTSNAIVESEKGNNVSVGYPWPYSHGCADVADKLGGTCADIDNGFELTAPTGFSLSFGGYTFDQYANSGIGPKNVCSLALYGDGGVVREHPDSASTVDDYTLPYQQHWNEGAYYDCGYADAIIDLGTTIDWTSYPVGSSCSGNTDTDYPTVSLTCTYPALPSVLAPASYNFDDGLVPAGFTMSGDAAWYIDSATATPSLRSGAITDNQVSCFAVTAAATSGVSFDVKVDSEWSDRLRLYVDGSQVDYWSGSVAWTAEDFPQTLGAHEYRWCYSKDGSISSGADAAWVDNINIY